MLRFPEEVLRNRYRRFQEVLRSKGLDAAVIKTLSTFIYITGIKWLRPGLVIPAEGEPVVFIARGEEEGFREVSWIKNIETFADGGELMGKVSSYIRSLKAKRVGIEFGVERDSYVFFYEMFKRLNKDVEVVDISDIVDEMKMYKDEYEKQYIREAGKKARAAIEKALDVVKPGLSETEVAAEIYSVLYRLGSESPLVYINAGPHPRIHSEPLSTVKIVDKTVVTVVVNADHFGYHANKSISIPVGDVGEIGLRALRCMDEVFDVAVKETRAGVKFIDVMKKLDEVYVRYGMLNYRVVGYAHSVGLKVEETPITTIVPKHRYMEVKPSMALAFIHAPIMLPGVGQIKKEETFIVREDGSLEQVT